MAAGLAFASPKVIETVSCKKLFGFWVIVLFLFRARTLNSPIVEPPRPSYSDPLPVVFPPESCDTCTKPDTILSNANSSSLDQDFTCYWPRWPTTRPREGHTATFLVSHLVTSEIERSLDHLQTFAAPDVADEVRTIVGVVNAMTNTICLGQSSNDCGERVVLSEEQRQAILDNPPMDFYEPEFYVKATQQILDFLGLGRLYLKNCVGQDDPLLFSFLDNDMATCPGFGYHLASIKQYAKRSLLARSGRPYGLRIAAGSSGFLIPPKDIDSFLDVLDWILAGESPVWWPVDYALDEWARGVLVAPGHEDAPAVGVFGYYATIMNHLGNNKSYFWQGEKLENRKVNFCGAALHWPGFAHDDVNCFGQAWTRCREEDWGEYVAGGVTDHEKVPDDYFDYLIAARKHRWFRQKRRARLRDLETRTVLDYVPWVGIAVSAVVFRIAHQFLTKQARLREN